MTGKSIIDKVFIILLLLTSAGTAGVFVYTELIYQRELPNNEQEFKTLVSNGKARSIPNVYQLEKLTINLKSRTAKLRFIDLEMYLVPFTAKDRDIIEQNKERIYDAIIDITAGMDPDELNTVSGKILLENRIKHNLNQTIKSDMIKEILFSVFVVI